MKLAYVYLANRLWREHSDHTPLDVKVYTNSILLNSLWCLVVRNHYILP